MPKKSTRNAQGAGTIRQRSDGRWEARYTVGRDAGTGKQVQRSIYGKTQAEVRKKLNQICSDIDNGVYIEPSKLTVGKWLDIWLSEYTGNVKPFTQKAYTDRVNLHIKPHIGAVKLSALTAPAIQKLYNELKRGSDEKPALSPKTIQNVHGVLHKALQQALMLGYIKFNPSDACTLPRVVKPEIQPLSEKELASFMEAIKGHKYEALFLVDCFTGMRQGELLGLTWDCVDFQNGSILVRQQLQKEKKKEGKFYLAPLKNDKSRRIVPAPYVMEMLKSVRRNQLTDMMRAGPLWQPGDIKNLVFVNEFGNHLVHGTVYKNFKAVLARIGLPEARFHDLRHTYAVMSIQAGDDIKTVQENLGHHTASFTLDVYGHVTEKMKQDSANRMQKYIDAISE